MPNYAFQITSEDIVNVLRSESLLVGNTNGKPFEEMAEDLIEELDCDRIEGIALAASNELEEQTSAAYEAIQKELVELGVLIF
tara:strand:+ start:6073 stop:6321 length:249 start_codon:yes stop_codon:yes gene_type:complete